MKTTMSLLILILLVTMGATSAFAGAKLKISDEASIDLGYRVQALGIFSKQMTDHDDDDKFDSYREWKLRRARFRLGGKVNDRVSAFLQTDVSGKDVQMIDAFITFKGHKWAQLVVGRLMAPILRQNLTSSGALMAIDRPGMAYKSLTWGGRALHTFSNATFGLSRPGGDNLGTSPDAVRDNGFTIFGSGDLGSGGNSHLKYYAGMYNGVQAGVDDKDRFTFRAQYNLWDAEGGYFQSSTYLGKKKTLGIGVAYDVQKEAGVSDPAGTPTLVDYAMTTVDGFLELPSSNGNALTVEVGYLMLDWNDAADFMASQGSGFYGQAGYFIHSGWQPWVEFESFKSDATDDTGSYDNFRIGLTYFLDGHHANIKAGYESFKSKVALMEEEDTIGSFVLGFYTTY